MKSLTKFMLLSPDIYLLTNLVIFVSSNTFLSHEHTHTTYIENYGMSASGERLVIRDSLSTLNSLQYKNGSFVASSAFEFSNTDFKSARKFSVSEDGTFLVILNIASVMKIDISGGGIE